MRPFLKLNDTLYGKLFTLFVALFMTPPTKPANRFISHTRKALRRQALLHRLVSIEHPLTDHMAQLMLNLLDLSKKLDELGHIYNDNVLMTTSATFRPVVPLRAAAHLLLLLFAGSIAVALYPFDTTASVMIVTAALSVAIWRNVVELQSRRRMKAAYFKHYVVELRDEDEDAKAMTEVMECMSRLKKALDKTNAEISECAQVMCRESDDPNIISKL